MREIIKAVQLKSDTCTTITRLYRLINGAQQERIREALARLDARTYGQCVDCGQPLPEERLEIRPEAARCVSCQQRVESIR